MADSFLSPATIAVVQRVNLRGHATVLALQGGGTQLWLSRYTETTEQWTARPAAQLVSVEWANQQERLVSSDSAIATKIDGSFEKNIVDSGAFDVEVGDRFSYEIAPGEGVMSGDVVIVHAPELGVQRADFRLRIAE